MTQTERPEKVRIQCTHCSHVWLEETSVVIGSPEIIHKDIGQREMVERRVTCPKCDRAVIVSIPKAWLDD
jgi:DNA-directed RNA polymerase subunit RPC12/RpoP